MNIDIAEFSARLFADQEIIPRARTIARGIAEALPGAAVVVYLIGTEDGADVWMPKAAAGDVTAHATPIPVDTGTLGEVASNRIAMLFAGKDLTRENYAHVDIRKTVRTFGYLPLLKDDGWVGAIEILSFDEELTEEMLLSLSPVADVAALALYSARAYETERHESLTSITRLSQLYDLEKVFSSTLEMDELLRIIGAKIREVMECQAVNVWLLQPDESVELSHQAGFDPTMPEGTSQRPGEGQAGAVSDNGEPLLIDDPDDAALVARNGDVEEGRIASMMVVPIMDKESLVGVIEVINKMDGTLFDDDDLFALNSLADTASTALHNASLLLAERKVEVLETLVTVSHEITSTLNLERMLQTIVNAPQAVIPYERGAIALEQRGRFKLSAVTGLTQVNADAPDIAPLNEILQWAALSEEVIHVRQVGEQIDSNREETRAKFAKYFSESGARAFYSMPLSDDTGRVGVFCLESRDPDFLSAAHLEILQVLAGQATVALRNAQMYKEVPFISILEPVLERKRKFMAMEKRQRTLILGLGAAALLFLVAVPLPLRVDGDAVAAPGRRALVQPEVEGVVSNVLVREGQSVKRGQVLGEMEAWNLRSMAAEAQSKYQAALLQRNQALAANDGTEGGVQQVQTDFWKAELGRREQLLERAQLRSPIDGVVATPHVDTFAGRKLQLGDTFAEVVDTTQTVIDVAIDDLDAGLLRDGEKVYVKLNSYPMRTFQGNVQIVSPKADLLREAPVFYARVNVPNKDGAIRAGMEGRGKVRLGWYPAGYVFLRRPLLWGYGKLWYWFGW